MSGGVDSSLSAALLVQEGYEVVGGFIKNWSDTKDLWTGECQWRGERRDALRVAAKLGIPLLTFDFEKEYRARVLDSMFKAYEEGYTPNPDVLCNQEIKFGLFYEAAMQQGFDGIAMGHYARVTHHVSRNTQHGEREVQTSPSELLKGVDPDKDQSYFLHRVSQEALSKSFFPVGGLLKSEVRKLAEKLALPTATKPDSQGICFVGKLDFHEFLRKRIPSSPGDIVGPDGEVLGRHDGLDAYTIGQRQGLLVSKGQHPWYVAGKNKDKNQLIIVPEREHPLMFTGHATIRHAHWISGETNKVIDDMHPLLVDVMIRYRQTPVHATVVGGPDAYQIRFDEPVWALAPGQSAVFYQGDVCLGGGILEEGSGV